MVILVETGEVLSSRVVRYATDASKQNFARRCARNAYAHPAMSKLTETMRQERSRLRQRVAKRMSSMLAVAQ